MSLMARTYGKSLYKSCFIANSSLVCTTLLIHVSDTELLYILLFINDWWAAPVAQLTACYCGSLHPGIEFQCYLHFWDVSSSNENFISFLKDKVLWLYVPPMIIIEAKQNHSWKFDDNRIIKSY